jgi:tetratricopeptide (TPR) repeat protein
MQGTLKVRRGDVEAIPQLHEAVDKLQAGGYRLRLTCHSGGLAAALGTQGRRREGLRMIRGALALCASGEERWCVPELLRVKGELLEADDVDAAIEAYHQALQVAQQQNALAWELRVAINLAELKTRRGQEEEGLRFLASVHDRFSEGFGTADLLKARALLARAT